MVTCDLFVLRTGRISTFLYLIRSVKYNCDVIILMFNHVECRIGKWHIKMTSPTHHGISTHRQLYCLLNRSFRQTRMNQHERNTSSRPFCEGSPPAMESPQTEPPKLWSSDPLQQKPLVTNGFIAHRASNIINYGMTNYITIT